MNVSFIKITIFFVTLFSSDAVIFGMYITTQKRNHHIQARTPRIKNWDKAVKAVDEISISNLNSAKQEQANKNMLDLLNDDIKGITLLSFLDIKDRQNMNLVCSSWNYDKMPNSLHEKLFIKRQHLPCIVLAASYNNDNKALHWLNNNIGQQNVDDLKESIFLMHNLYGNKIHKLSNPKCLNYDLFMASCSGDTDTVNNILSENAMKLIIAPFIYDAIHNNDIDAIVKYSDTPETARKIIYAIHNDDTNFIKDMFKDNKLEDNVIACTIVAAMRNGDIGCLKALAKDKQFSDYMKKYSNKLLYQHLFRMHCYRYNHHQNICKDLDKILACGYFNINQPNLDCQFTWAGTVLDLVRGHKNGSGLLSSFYMRKIKWREDFVNKIEKVLIKHGAEP